MRLCNKSCVTNYTTKLQLTLQKAVLYVILHINNYVHANTYTRFILLVIFI